MRKTAIIVSLLLIHFHLTAQFVGINTNAPQAMLHVKDSNILFSGPNPFVNYTPAANPPSSGPGTRLMWYAQKGAFRAGWVENNNWDKDSMGPFSIALGHSPLAYNVGSVALGMRTKAYGFAAQAMGYNSQAMADYSFAAGYQSIAAMPNATAIGTESLASGYFSTALGIHSVASGNSATAIGDSSVASGAGSVAIGSYVRTKGMGAFAAGWYNDISDNPDPVFSNPNDRIFQIGNGSGFTLTRSNALTVLRNGHHGLGTVNPAARLHVADSNVVFTGAASVPPSTIYNPPAEGAGVRMMWYPQKGAFRAGAVNSTQWDKDSIGNTSVALGSNTKAKGEGAFAAGINNNAAGRSAVTMGENNNAGGANATALGLSNNATGDKSTAMGFLSNASGERAISLGYVANAAGFNSTAIGFAPIAAGNYSVSIGSNTVAAGGASVAMGDNARATGVNSASIGYYTRARSDYSFVVGKFNDSSATNRIFEIGIGTSEIARKNAVTVLQTGRTGVNTNTPLAMLHVADSSVVFNATGSAMASPGVPPVSNAGRRMMWYADRAAFRAGYVSADQWNRENTGDYTFAAGYDTKASSIGSVATGITSIATGFTSVAMGYQVTVNGVYSAGFGYNNTANGYYSLVTGSNSSTSGSNSVALGESLTSKALGGFVSGRFNDNGDNPNVFTAASTDRIFQIGNGNDNASRSNAVTVLRNGNMGIGHLNPARPLSFPASLGEKILLYPGSGGEVGIGVYGNELRLHSDNPGAMVSFGTQDNAGNFTQAGRFQISGAYALYANGSIWANGTTYASDERFKQNITPITSPLEKLMQINGVEYELNTAAFPKNNFQKGRQIGLLAQNVEKVIPEAVNELDGYKGVDYAKLVPLLIEALKEQQQQRKQDLERIEKLEKMISELKK